MYILFFAFRLLLFIKVFLICVLPRKCVGIFLVVVFIVVFGLVIVSNVIFLLFTILVMIVDVDPALVWGILVVVVVFCCTWMSEILVVAIVDTPEVLGMLTVFENWVVVLRLVLINPAVIAVSVVESVVSRMLWVLSVIHFRLKVILHVV